MKRNINGIWNRAGVSLVGKNKGLRFGLGPTINVLGFLTAKDGSLVM